MKIGMLNCLKSNKCCAGAACLNAFNRHEKFFERYKDEPVELTAFARCNGCSAGIDDGFAEKLDRMVSEGIKAVHLGVCTTKDGKECFTITKAAKYLSERGIEIVRGTH